MSYIPLVRDKMTNSIYNKEDVKPNPYYEGLLGDEEKECIKGYDVCAEEAAENAFYNLDAYEKYFEALGLNMTRFTTDALFAQMKSEKSVVELDKKEIDSLTYEEKIVTLLHEILQTHMEMYRSEIVTTMIEGLDDSEYEKNYKKVFEEEDSAIIDRIFEEADGNMAVEELPF